MKRGIWLVIRYGDEEVHCFNLSRLSAVVLDRWEQWRLVFEYEGGTQSIYLNSIRDMRIWSEEEFVEKLKESILQLQMRSTTPSDGGAG